MAQPSTQSNVPLTVNLWPEGKMPGRAAKEPETEIVKGDGFHRIANVSCPTVTLYRAPQQDTPAPAIIVSPGGGYGYVVIDKEGSEIAAWLNSQDITALVLKYRNPGNREGALCDLQRAISLTRVNASKWNIDPRRLGVMGFSAGGHLSAQASNHFEPRNYGPIDEIDTQSCRPDFAVLVYPAYLGSDGKVASDLNLKADIPPTLILHSDDDKPYVPGSRLYDAALTEAGRQHAFICYPTGGHGYGLHCQRDAKAWPDDMLAWLKKIGIR